MGSFPGFVFAGFGLRTETVHPGRCVRFRFFLDVIDFETTLIHRIAVFRTTDEGLFMLALAKIELACGAFDLGLRISKALPVEAGKASVGVELLVVPI